MKNAISITGLGVLLIACSHDYSVKNKTTKTDQLSDDQVSEIVTTANDGEVLLAQQVVENTTNPHVKEFARHMIDDHTLNNMENRNIAIQANINPEESAKSKELTEKEKTTQKELKGLTGRQLDVAYMDDQIKTHEMVFNDLKNTLIPEAKDPELKEHLKMTCKKVEEHLEEAKQIREAL